MPHFLARIFYAFRGKRRVRYHLYDGRGGLDGPTLEGVEIGCFAGHYVAVLGKQVEEQRTLPLEGSIEIPRDRVIFRQVLR